MRTTAVLSLTLLAIFALPALAEEIIYFTDGDSMAIRSHVVEGEMIQVDLGGNAFIGFPIAKVERIEAAGKNVFLSRSSSSNQIFENVPDPSGSHPVRGRRPARYSGDNAPLPLQPPSEGRIKTDSNGMAVFHKFADSNHDGKRKLGTVGSGPIFGAPPSSPNQGGKYAGTHAVGRSHVLGSSVPPGTKARRPVTGFARRSGATPGPPATSKPKK